MKQIILASSSPRRRDILEQIGVSFTVVPSNADETISASDPAEYVKELSKRKAFEVAQRTEGESIILGSDTVVVHKNEILGKPADKTAAFKMLRSLSGDVHFVYSGVTIIIREKDGQLRSKTFAVSTEVKVTELTDSQIDAYIASGEPMDKAGAYAIQGRFAPYIEEIRGDYYNIVGFPIAAVVKGCAEMGENII